ncbi:MAG: penicillin-binding protein 2 [Chthonomonas sp.]|nr:penicillin-binding protein 2 [Chthonomonas sp.]
MKRRQENSRSKWATLAMCGLFGIAGLSQVNVQLVSSGKIQKLANDAGRYKQSKTLAAQRGTIMSADGRVLARTETAYEFGVNFADIPKSRALFADLGAAAGISPAELETAASERKSVYYSRLLTSTQGEAVERIKEAYRANGISTKRVSRREYPLGNDTSGILGLVRAPLDPKTELPILDEHNKPLPEKGSGGLEQGQEKLLRGVDGLREGMRDVDGNFLPLRSKQSIDRKQGAEMVLTIDSQLQQVAAQFVEKAVVEHKATSGVALVMDISNGDLMACAQFPAFDPEVNKNARDYNPAYMATYEPGSTFKILTLAEALQNGSAQVGETIPSSGSLTYKGITVSDSHAVSGQVSQERAIAESSNVLAATWAIRMGREKIRGFIDRSGLTSKVNIGVVSEAHGAYDASDDSIAQTMVMGFGQGFKSTPIAFLSAFSAIGNHGMQVHPRLIKSVDGVEQPNRAPKQLFNAATSDYVLTLMEAVFHKGGTGKHLIIPGYRLAGKTGTAEKKGTKNGGYVSNFVGFVPATNPRAVVLVMIDDPRAGSYYGGSVAGPVFREIARSLIQKYRIKPQTAADIAEAREMDSKSDTQASFALTQMAMDSVVAMWNGQTLPADTMKPSK